MFRDCINFIKHHFDFNMYGTTYLSLFFAFLIIPCVIFAPQEFGYENGVLENIQLVFLFLMGFLALKSKTDKKFFTFIFLVVTILFLREINCGRTIFFAVPGEVNSFYRWSEIKYGWLAHPLYGMYIASVGIYFLKNKLFINLWQKISKIKLPVWDISLMTVGMILGLYAEEVAHNFILEEITELLFYVALFGIVYLYSQNKKFIETNQDKV